MNRKERLMRRIEERVKERKTEMRRMGGRKRDWRGVEERVKERKT